MQDQEQDPQDIPMTFRLKSTASSTQSTPSEEVSTLSLVQEESQTEESLDSLPEITTSNESTSSEQSTPCDEDSPQSSSSQSQEEPLPKDKCLWLVTATLGQSPTCQGFSSEEELATAASQHIATAIDIDVRMFIFRGELVPILVGSGVTLSAIADFGDKRISLVDGVEEHVPSTSGEIVRKSHVIETQSNASTQSEDEGDFF